MIYPGQFGEALVIEDLVGTLIHGYAADVGASDGKSINNTYALEERGWDVLCIEANSRYEKALRENRKRVMMVACGRENLEDQDFHVYEFTGAPGNYEPASALHPVPIEELVKIGALPPGDVIKPVEVQKVPVRTLDWCLKEAGFPRLDVLSIDVEGGEQDVLDGFSIDIWQPQIIVIEDWKGGEFGEYMRQHGYEHLRRTGVNEIFVRDSRKSTTH